MKRIHWTGLFLGLVVLGCNSGTNGETKGAISSETPKELKGTLEVEAFDGGYNLDQYKKAAAEFEKLNPV